MSNHLKIFSQPQSDTACRRQRAQGLVEFALILPLLLLFLLGVVEVGRMLAIYSSVSSAAKQAARYGSVGGDAGNGQPFFLDCAGMRAKAQQTSILQPLANADITIRYDRGLITQTIGSCPLVGATPTLSETIKDGDRVVISITTTYSPLVPIVPLPALPMTFEAAHTIFTTIVGPTPTPVPNPDLMISKVGFPNPVLPGSTNLTYELQVTNTGAIEANSVVVTDTLPTSINPATITVLPAPPTGTGAAWTCSQAGLVVTCTLPFLAAGFASSLIDLQVTAPVTPGVITNVARVADDLTDPQPSNNVATATTTVMTAVDLQLQKISLVNPVGAGNPITYALTVKNNGSVDANPVVVTDTLPANTTFVPAQSGGVNWSCSQGSGTVTCILAVPLPVGSTAPTITVVILAPYPGAIPPSGYVTNSATATSQLSDPFPSNNTNIAVTTTVTTDANLAMFKFGPPAADSGSNYPYTLRVTNNGPSVATNVRVVDTVPAAIRSVTAGVGWTCTTTGSQVACVYAPVLAAGATTSDIVVIVLAPDANVVLANTAIVLSDEPDPQPLNNTATVTTTVSVCHHNEVDAAHSLMSASPTDVFADNSSTSRILVTLRDACDQVLLSPPYNSQLITLTSSRPSLDTIALAPGYNNPTSSGQVAFDVKSGTPGTSTYSATAKDTVTNASVSLASTAQVNFYGCVGDSNYHLSERPFGGLGQQYLQFRVDNASGLTRHLTGVNLTWPQSGARKVQSLTMQLTILWSGSTKNNPFQIPAGGLNWNAGTDPARTLSSGANNQTLQFNFDYSVVASDSINLTTTWDDGSGGRVCTATFP